MAVYACLIAVSSTRLSAQPPDPSQIPEPQVTYALHAVWVPDLTVASPQSQCVTSGTVAIPHFHFYAGWKDGAPAFFSVDWILIEELTNEHDPQIWYFENPQGESGFPYRCTMPPVSDLGNWNWTTWSLAGAMIGFAMHNSPYRITVQWRYGVYMKGPRGPFQTSITVNVQNLVVTSGDEMKVLKWDPVRGVADTTFSYSLECAQRKACDVCISIYTTDGMKVYETWLEQEAPGSYSFTWDGTVNVVPPPPPPDGLAPAGLYVFDIEVIGAAPGYDEDCLRSRALRVGERELSPLTNPTNSIALTATLRYILRSNRDAAQAYLEGVNPIFKLIFGPEHDGTHAIPENAQIDWWNEIGIFTDGSEFVYAGKYPFVI